MDRNLHDEFQSLPDRLRFDCTFTVYPVYWNLGINHEATFAQSIAGDSSLEQSINLVAAKKLDSYVSSLKEVSQSAKDLAAELHTAVR